LLSAEFPPDPGALFSDIQFAGRGCVVAAVSGGGDSLALLLLLHDHLKRLPAAPKLLAVTVDHGLRAEAAEEARQVGRVAEAHGIAHRIMRWEGAKPATGISAAARLLVHAAREAGSDLVLTGHTADDQAETLAMRLARGKGRGIAGIASSTLYDGDVWFVRPLLEVRRNALRSFLRDRGLSWVEDPSNVDPRFERARIRRGLGDEAVQELLSQARGAGEARADAGRQAAALIRRGAERVAPGLLRISMDEIAAEAGAYVLRILLAVTGGTPQLPDEARARAILARMHQDGVRASLSRTVVTSRGGMFYLHRERRHLPDCALETGLMWDGRYRVAGVSRDMQAASTRVAPFGAENAREAVLYSKDAPAGLQRAALAAEPAVWKEAQCLGLAADVEGLALQPLAAPWARLLPSFDLAPAAAVQALIGAAPLPPPPWHGHKAV
jgi:tRNA(Ile)-lysidine synthase